MFVCIFNHNNKCEILFFDRIYILIHLYLFFFVIKTNNMLSPINELGFTDENQQKIDSIEPKTSDNIDENQRSIIVNESQPL